MTPQPKRHRSVDSTSLPTCKQLQQRMLLFLLSCIQMVMSSRTVYAFHYLHRVSSAYTKSQRYLQRGHRSIVIRNLSQESRIESSPDNHKEQVTNGFFASENLFPTFESIGVQSPILLRRIHDYLSSIKPNMTSPRPSAVQAASFKAIQSGEDVTIGAEVRRREDIFC